MNVSELMGATSKILVIFSSTLSVCVPKYSRESRPIIASILSTMYSNYFSLMNLRIVKIQVLSEVVQMTGGHGYR